MRLTLLYKRLLYIVPLVGFLVLATIAAAVLNRGAATVANVPVSTAGKDIGPYPPFSTEGLTAADLKGKTVLVTFFASWCIPCMVEHPVLMELSKNVPIYGFDFMDKPSALDALLKRNGNPYTKMGYDADGVAAVAWGVVGVPTSFIVGSNGHILYRHDGPITMDDAKNIILPLMKKAP